MWDPLAGFESVMLSNGLVLHYKHVPVRPWQHFGFVVHAGAAHDPEGKEGLAHFVEHMATHVPGLAREWYAMLLSQSGGYAMYGETSYIDTYYSAFVSRHIIPETLRLFGSMLRNTFEPSAIEHEREIITHEIKRDFRNEFSADVVMEMRRRLYAGSPLARMPAPYGTVSSVAGIAREDVHGFKSRYYNPKNISVISAGGLHARDLIGLLEDSPLGIEGAGSVAAMPPIEHAFACTEGSSLRFSARAHPGKVASRETAGYETTGMVPGNVSIEAVQVFARMLESRLHHEFRDRRRWTYGVTVDVLDFKTCREVEIECDSFPPEFFREVVMIIDDAIDAVAGDHMTRNAVITSCVNELRMQDMSVHAIIERARLCVSAERRVITNSERIRRFQSVTAAQFEIIRTALMPARRWSLLLVP